MFFSFLFSIFLYAQPFPEDSCTHHYKNKREWKELNLNKEQKEKLRELRREMDIIRKNYVDSIREIRLHIKEELLKEEPSLTSLEKFASILGELYKNMTMKRFEHLLKVKNILTKEQFEKLVSLEEKERCFMRKPRRGFPPPPPY